MWNKQQRVTTTSNILYNVALNRNVNVYTLTISLYLTYNLLKYNEKLRK